MAIGILTLELKQISFELVLAGYFNEKVIPILG